MFVFELHLYLHVYTFVTENGPKRWNEATELVNFSCTCVSLILPPSKHLFLLKDIHIEIFISYKLTETTSSYLPAFDFDPFNF